MSLQKGGGDINDIENYYGQFDSNCFIKNTQLIPNPAATLSVGCQGYTAGTLLHIGGGTNIGQPPFTVTISNPSMTVVVDSTGVDRGNQAVTPWPSYLVYTGAILTITGNTPGNVCTSTLTVTPGSPNNTLTFSGTLNPAPNPQQSVALNCTGAGVNCNNDGSATCFLPATY